MIPCCEDQSPSDKGWFEPQTCLPEKKTNLSVRSAVSEEIQSSHSAGEERKQRWIENKKPCVSVTLSECVVSLPLSSCGNHPEKVHITSPLNSG